MNRENPVRKIKSEAAFHISLELLIGLGVQPGDGIDPEETTSSHHAIDVTVNPADWASHFANFIRKQCDLKCLRFQNEERIHFFFKVCTRFQ